MNAYSLPHEPHTNADVAHGLIVCVVVRSLNKRVELALEGAISYEMVTLTNEVVKLPFHGNILGLEGIQIRSFCRRKLLCNILAIDGGSRSTSLRIISHLLEGTSIVCLQIWRTRLFFAFAIGGSTLRMPIGEAICRFISGRKSYILSA